MKRGAHPRVCGENKRPRRYEREPVGSSPRVRGKRRQVFESTRRRGLIPACAGKTPSQRQPPSKAWAHPRVCGENAGLSDVRLTVNGSSPRVRGKPRTSRRRPRGMGLIPACAGKTQQIKDEIGGARAHPRVCGENPPLHVACRGGGGSSPRVRGKLDITDLDVAAWGLIPACAGKTSRLRDRARRQQAHPRVCGENSRLGAFGGDDSGSSPRVRGKPTGALALARVVGLIPACAGKTASGSERRSQSRAHPRVCGENSHNMPPMCLIPGSSPRVRGKLCVSVGPCNEAGLIPACAGKTLSPAPWLASPRAHPRVCGENVAKAESLAFKKGSSPRVRGKL